MFCKEKTNEIGKIGEKYVEEILFPLWGVNFLNVTQTTPELNCSFFQNVDIDYIISYTYTTDDLKNLVADTININNKLFFDTNFDFIEVKTQTERNFIKDREFRFDVIKCGGIPGGIAKTRAKKIVNVYLDSKTNRINSVIMVNLIELRKWMTKENNVKHFIIKPYEKGECLNIYIPMKILLENNIVKQIYEKP